MAVRNAVVAKLCLSTLMVLGIIVSFTGTSSASGIMPSATSIKPKPLPALVVLTWNIPPVGLVYSDQLQPVGNKGGPVASASATPNEGTTNYASTTPLVCSINSTTGALTINGAGTCTITADDAGGGGYGAAIQITESLQVAGEPVTLTWNTPPTGLAYPVVHTGGHGHVVVIVANATATPNVGSITYRSLTPLVCTIDTNSGALTVVGPGTCTLTANDVAGGNYAAAQEISESFAIAGTFRTTPSPFTSLPIAIP